MKSDLIIHHDIESYIQSVTDFLESAEAENGLLLGNLERLRADSPAVRPFMAQVVAEGRTVCVAYYRDRNLLISRGPEGIWKQIARKLLEEGFVIPGVVGPSNDAERLAAEWVDLRRCGSELAMNQRVYQLVTVSPPSGIPGGARLVRDGDIETLKLWMTGFYQDAIPWEMPSAGEVLEAVKARIPAGLTYLWEMDGKPVAMTALSRPTRRGFTVNAVYTPPEYRKRGYASALVAAVSSEGLNRGKEFCVLYTDLSNPTSNSIYQKIGYKPVCDSRHYRFS